MSKKKWQLLMNLAVIAVFIYLYTQLDYKSIFDTLKQMSVASMIWVFVLQVADMLLTNYQNQRLTNHLGYKVSFWRMNFVTSMGHLFDAITPGGGVGGEAVKIMMLKKYADVPISSGTAAILSQKAIGTCAVLTFCTVGFGALVVTSDMEMALWMEIGIFMVLIAIVAFLATIFLNPHKAIGRCQRIKHEKFRGGIINFLEGVKSISADKKECFKEIIISFIMCAIYPFKLNIILKVTHVNISFIAAYSVIFISYALAMLPIFPGGMLGFEVAMTTALGFYGVQGNDGVLISTLFRIVTYWFVILFSVVYIGMYKLMLEIRYRNPVHNNLK